MTQIDSRFPWIAAGALALAAFRFAPAQAATLTIDVAGVQGNGELGDSANPLVSYDIGANSVLTSISWSVNVTAFSPSWLSEIGFAFGNSTDYNDRYVSVGFGDHGGTAAFSDSVDLTPYGITTSSDGKLVGEYMEVINDPEVTPDDHWNSGSITIEYTTVPVPEPATYALMFGGLGLVGWAAARRRSSAPQ